MQSEEKSGPFVPMNDWIAKKTPVVMSYLKNVIDVPEVLSTCLFY